MLKEMHDLITAQFADEAATLAASWALVLVVLVRDALAVHEQRRIANARKPTEDGEQLLLFIGPPMVLAAAAVSLCGARNCICGRRVVELVLTVGLPVQLVPSGARPRPT